MSHETLTTLRTEMLNARDELTETMYREGRAPATEGRERIEAGHETERNYMSRLCECGCGQPTKISERNDSTWGHVKGQSLRFIRGHGNKGKVHPNKAIHFADGVTVLALQRQNGDVLPCYLDTKDYFDFKVGEYRWTASPIGKTLYAVRNLPTRTHLHQLLMPLPEGLTPDHKDRNGLNNRRDNLRPATWSQQNRNHGRSKANTSGFIGVSHLTTTGKYQATIRVESGKNKNLGMFTDPVEAALVRDAMAKQIYGVFAVLNFPEKEASHV